MSRLVLPAFAMVLALSSLAGCASSAHPQVQHSLAEQVRSPLVAEAAPNDFDMEFSPKERSGRITKDVELTGSLRASSPTRTSDE
jgi:hypothetical protein